MAREAHKKDRVERPRVVLIGRRNGALAAARKLGLRPLVIDVRARREQSTMAYGGTSAWALSEAITANPGHSPTAVLAVTTGSVMAAAAIREHFGLAGISSETALRCHDKLVMKKAIAGAGIPCAPWRETNPDSTPHELIQALGLPLVLKLPISSGGRGVWICRNEAEVSEHLRPDLLAESFIDGVEMSVETFRTGGATLFQNHTRYLIPRIANIVPADVAFDTVEKIHALSELIHEVFGITSGITHMEIFLTAQGPVFGEIAARPPGGFLMELIGRAYGFAPWEALLRIALGETPELPQNPIRHAGVLLLHPGEGTVSEVRGLEECRSLPGIREIFCKLQPGDQIYARIGSGESVGQILAEGKGHDDCVRNLELASRTLAISLT